MGSALGQLKSITRDDEWPIEIHLPAEASNRGHFDVQVAACLPQLRLFARRLTSSPAEAADLVQETCLRALEKWRTFVWGSLDDLIRWLRVVMRNHHFDRSQKQRREVPIPYLGEIVDDVDIGPCQQWRLVDDHAVSQAISALPALLQVPYLLFTGGRCYAAIATTLGIPENTVGTRIRRARKRLQRTLQWGVEAAHQQLPEPGRRPRRPRDPVLEPGQSLGGVPGVRALAGHESVPLAIVGPGRQRRDRARGRI